MSGDSRGRVLFGTGSGPGLLETLLCIYSFQRHSPSPCSDDSNLGPKEFSLELGGTAWVVRVCWGQGRGAQRKEILTNWGVREDLTEEVTCELGA